MLIPLLRDRVASAVPSGLAAVAKEIAAAGRGLNQDLSSRLVSALATFPRQSLFRQCVVEAAAWASFVAGDDPRWPQDATEYLRTGSRQHIQPPYGSGRRQADLMAYLNTWQLVFDELGVPEPPNQGASSTDLVTFYRASSVAIQTLESRKQRSQVGPWSFHGAFKLFLLHQDRLWVDSTIDEIVMPMGGEAPRSRKKVEGYSFEAGWEFLRTLNLVPPLPQKTKSPPSFRDGMMRTELAHAEVRQLAGLVADRALHLNTGIYCLGAPTFLVAGPGAEA